MKIKKSLIEYEIEEDEDIYKQYFRKIPVLQELSRVPFTLRMILTNFSDLKKNCAKK
jgi:hypothetical protein